MISSPAWTETSTSLSVTPGASISKYTWLSSSHIDSGRLDHVEDCIGVRRSLKNRSNTLDRRLTGAPSVLAKAVLLSRVGSMVNLLPSSRATEKEIHSAFSGC